MIYAVASDPLVNWDAGDLAADLEAAGFRDINLQLNQDSEQRRISAADLSRWFPDSESYETGGERASYARRLANAGLSPADIDRVARLYDSQLRGQLVSWQRVVLIVQALGG